MRFFRFLVAGGVGVGMYYATLYILTEFVGVWYLISAVIAFGLNWAVNFTLQKLWTFQNRRKETVGKESFHYVSMMLGILISNTGLLYVLVEHANLQYLVAQVILTLMLAPVSFLLSCKIFATKTP